MTTATHFQLTPSHAAPPLDLLFNVCASAAGLQGDRGADQSMQMTRDTPISKDGGFSVEVKMPMFNREYMVDFKPPCLVKCVIHVLLQA